MPTTLDLWDKPLFRQIIIVEVATHRLPIVRFYLTFETLLELIIVYALDLTGPFRVDVLHVAVEAAELGQEFSLVEVPRAILNISLDPRLFIKSTIRVQASFVKRCAEKCIILQPLFSLLLDGISASLSGEWDDVKVLITKKTFIILLREEVYLNVQQSSQKRRFVVQGRLNDFFIAWQLPDLIIGILFVFATTHVSRLDCFSDSDAHGDEKLRCLIYSDSSLLQLLTLEFIDAFELGHRLPHDKVTIFHMVVEERWRLFWVAQEEEQIQHEVSHLWPTQVVGWLYDQISEETVEGFKAEHIDCIATLLEETVVKELDEVDCILEEGLRIQRTRVEIERKDSLT